LRHPKKIDNRYIIKDVVRKGTNRPIKGVKKDIPEGIKAMKKVIILALEKTVSSTVTGPMDILSQTGVLWNQIFGLAPSSYFKVAIATVSGKPVECLNGVVIKPHFSIKEVKNTDLVIISSEDLQELEKTYRQTRPWLLKLFREGTTLAAFAPEPSCWPRPDC
jgi:transcriptional regulator GlxA family with amidase domain